MRAKSKVGRRVGCFMASLVAGVLVACSPDAPLEVATPTDEVPVDVHGFHAPEPATRAANQSAQWQALLADDADFELALRGLIASDPDLDIRTAEGRPVWRPADYAFLDAEAPSSVNPSLWRQSQLANIHGLFEVVPGIYQVRGYDLANMSIIEGETGRILIDPLTSVETARAALDLVNRELGDRPVVAVILTHSHIDHFGGLAGVVSSEQIASGEVALIAPEHFLEESVSENVLAGTVMARRASYMYGMSLPRTPRGHVGSGLGQHPAIGTHTIDAPTHSISETGTTLVVDGVEMEFQHAPHTEAPAEMTVYFPQYQAWCGAEIVSRTMHNLYTLRGAQVRSALAWSSAIEQSRQLYGGRSQVVFNSHHWPVWGEDEIDAYLIAQRDVYKFIHDQTLRLAGQGLRPDEIAETLRLPESLDQTFAVRGYYGTLKHNARAVYQYYFGWYDAVPAHLDPLPRTEAAQLYVDGFGGLDALLTVAQSGFEAGNYRWSAELAQHGVFAQPDSRAARDLLARSYEQMGYQAESGPWRDVYLSAAQELREGVARQDATAAATDILSAIPLDQFFMSMATRLDAERAGDRAMRFNFVFTDVDEIHLIEVVNGVMHHTQVPVETDEVDATVRVTRDFWLRLIQQEAGLLQMIASSEFAIEGDRGKLLGFFGLLEQPDEEFAIVTP